MGGALCYPSTAASVQHLGADDEPPSPLPPTSCCVFKSGRVKVDPAKGNRAWMESKEASSPLAKAGDAGPSPATPQPAAEASAGGQAGASDATVLPAAVEAHGETPHGDTPHGDTPHGTEPNPAGEDQPPSPAPAIVPAEPPPVASKGDDNVVVANSADTLPGSQAAAESELVVKSQNNPLAPIASPVPVPAPLDVAAARELKPLPSPGPKYGASIPVGGGKFIPVGSGASSIPVAQKIDFESEKAKIEAEFTKLEEQFDSGAKTKEEVEVEFDALTRKADTLRRLQEAETAAAKAQLAPRATQLAPVRVTQRQAPRDPASTPSMAVVHWKKVTKEQFMEYRTKLVEKYGSGPDAVKSIERIPNRILITAPIAAVMEKILADEELDPRPEPYVLPSAKKTLPPVKGK